MAERKDSKVIYRAADICFWLGILCELAVSFSGYAFGNYGETKIIFAAMFFFAVKILLTMDLKKDWPLFLICGIYGGLCYYFQSSALILRIFLLLLAGRDQDAKKVMQVFSLGTLAVMLVTGILSACGLHNELYLTGNYRNEAETRFCFGFFNPNGFAVFIFKLFIMSLYGFWDRLKWWGGFILLFLTLPLMLLAGSKTGLLALGILFVYLLLMVFLKQGKLRSRIFYWFGNAVMALELLSIYLVLFCMKQLRTWEIAGINFWKLIDWLTTGRLQAARKLFLELPPTLMGKPEVSNATEIGFFNSLYHEGVIFVGLYIILLFWFLFRLYKKQDDMGMILVVGITIYCFGEAFLPYVNKNIIFLLMIGNLPFLGTGRKRMEENT